MLTENSNNNNMNSSLVNENYVINILNEEDNKIDVLDNKIDVPDDTSEISDVDDIKTNTKLNTYLNSHLNSHLNLPKQNFIKSKKIYGKESNNKEWLVKLFIIILLLIIGSPIIICDLYYGYTDNSCINDYPNGLNINMKIYLLVNGYYCITIISLISLSIMCINIKNIEYNVSHFVLPIIIQIIFVVFTTVWTIIGSVIFWGKLYKEDICDRNISTYLFVTLIIKLLSSSFAMNKLLNDK